MKSFLHPLWMAFMAAAVLLAPPVAHADYLTIRVPAYSDGVHAYFSDLLYMALEQDGHLTAIEKVMDIPHLREREMLSSGDISVLWLFRSEERDKKYIPVPVGLTNGLMGQRILLIPPGSESDFKGVESLGDFRRLGKVGGFGMNWFDVGVWNTNHLPYLEVAEWRLLYDMVASGMRGVDYFSRGFSEIVREARNHPKLAIEPHLMLVYERDFIFYVSPQTPGLAPIIEHALIKARDSGLMGRLIKKHWAESYDIIKPEKRTIIQLKVPE